MLKEDYVSLEVAKLLKDKGFDECCYACYDFFESGVTLYKGWTFEYEGIPVHNSSSKIKCPTHQMAMKWLREAKGIYITIGHGDYPSLKKHFFMPTIEDLEAVYGVDDEEVTQDFDTYEEAVEAALKYCLTKVI